MDMDTYGLLGLALKELSEALSAVPRRDSAQ